MHALMNSTVVPFFIYLDLETAPTQDDELHREITAKHAVAPLDLSTIRADGRLKDEARIAEDIAAKTAKAIAEHAIAVEKAAAAADAEWRKTALDAASGHVATASWAVNDDRVDSLENWEFTPDNNPSEYLLELVQQGEAVVIETLIRIWSDAIDDDARIRLGEHFDAKKVEFFNGLDRESYIAHGLADARRRPIFVCHHANFDLVFLYQRMLALGIPVPGWFPVHPRPWDMNFVHDTMLMWAGATGRIGLGRLARALGVGGKGDIDGSMVWDLITSGQLDRVVAYNESDVELLRRVHKRLRGIQVAPVAAGVHATPLPAGRLDLRTSPELTAKLLATEATQAAAAQQQVA